MKKFAFIALALLFASPAHAIERYKALPTEKDNREMGERLLNNREFLLKPFLRNPEKYHWTGFYSAAEALYHQNKMDDALMWYYAGQIRARVAAGLDPDPSRNNAMLSAFGYGIGEPIMEYAHEDYDNWVKQIDRALAWDKEHPLPNDPAQVIGITEVAWDSANFQEVYKQVREGLVKMRDQIAARN